MSTIELKLACSSLTFGKLANKKHFEKTLDEIKETGYSGLQIEYDYLPPILRSDPKQVSELVESRGLQTVAVAVTFSKDMGYFTQNVGAKVGTLCLFEKDFDTAARKTKDLLKFYSKLGLSLSAQPHVRSNLESIEQTKELIERCKLLPLTLTFDTAHLTALGVELIEFIGIFGDKISMVHLKDLKSMKDIQKIDFEIDFVDLGDGIVNFSKTLKALKRARYEGWLVVEVDHPQEKTAFASIKKNFERLSQILP